MEIPAYTCDSPQLIKKRARLDGKIAKMTALLNIFPVMEMFYCDVEYS